MAKTEIEFGDVEVSKADFAPKAVRRRISIMIPEDVLAKLREIGARQGKGYQTVANELLREAAVNQVELGERFTIIKGQRQVVKQLEEIQQQFAGFHALLKEKVKKPTPKRAAKKR